MRLVCRAPKVRHDSAGPLGLLAKESGVPVLTDGATGCRSFGPQACARFIQTHFSMSANLLTVTLVTFA
jgi:hypothetical protein